MRRKVDPKEQVAPDRLWAVFELAKLVVADLECRFGQLGLEPLQAEGFLTFAFFQRCHDKGDRILVLGDKDMLEGIHPSLCLPQFIGQAPDNCSIPASSVFCWSSFH